MAMAKIVPVFQDYTPTQEETPNVTGWYVDDTVEVLTTDPNRSSVESMLLAQGYYLDDEVDNVRYFTRRRVDTESVLHDEIAKLTDAYNEGRFVNDARFEDLITIWKTTLDYTENELISLQTNDVDYTDQIDSLINDFEDAFADHYSDVDGFLDDWGNSETTRINTDFTAKLAAIKQSMIDKNAYNATAWASVVIGVERELQVALTDSSDKVAERKIAEKNRLWQLNSDYRRSIIDIKSRIMTVIHSQSAQRTSIRNQIADALNRFAERRNDGYPDLGKISTVISEIGSNAPGAFTP